MCMGSLGCCVVVSRAGNLPAEARVSAGGGGVGVVWWCWVVCSLFRGGGGVPFLASVAVRAGSLAGIGCGVFWGGGLLGFGRPAIWGAPLCLPGVPPVTPRSLDPLRSLWRGARGPPGCDVCNSSAATKGVWLRGVWALWSIGLQAPGPGERRLCARREPPRVWRPRLGVPWCYGRHVAPVWRSRLGACGGWLGYIFPMEGGGALGLWSVIVS